MKDSIELPRKPEPEGEIFQQAYLRIFEEKIPPELTSAPEIPKGYNLLEVGCGVGSNAYHLSISNPQIRVVGLDSSELAIVKGRELFSAPNLELKVGNVYRLNEIKEEFDMVFCILGLHHFNNLRFAFRNIYDILKKRGLFGFCDFDRKYSEKDVETLIHGKLRLEAGEEEYRLFVEHLVNEEVGKDKLMLYGYRPRLVSALIRDSRLAAYTVNEVLNTLKEVGFGKDSIKIFDDVKEAFLVHPSEGIFGGVAHKE